MQKVIIDMVFRLTGKSVPRDHAYQLYSNLSRLFPFIHESKEMGIHRINGISLGGGMLELSKTSVLGIRLPADLIKLLLPLSGKTLDLGGNKVIVGVPEIHSLQCKSALRSKMAIIKGFMESEPFIQAVTRQMDAMGAKGEIHLGGRQVMKIKDKAIVGFGMAVSGMDAESSLKLQENGIGGRRKMGCGLFIPVKGEIR